MDCRPRPHLEDAGSQEKARFSYRQDVKANGGRNAAKSVQYGIIARLACLRLGKQATGFSVR